MDVRRDLIAAITDVVTVVSTATLADAEEKVI